MQIIIHTTSYVPIYEQIVDQIKAGIREESFQENEHLPSFRPFISQRVEDQRFDRKKSL